jgi:hypothetical protein
LSASWKIGKNSASFNRFPYSLPVGCCDKICFAVISRGNSSGWNFISSGFFAKNFIGNFICSSG